MKSLRGALAAALIVGAATSALVGCSGSDSSSVKPDRSVKAQFDYDRALLQLPLDPYRYVTEYYPLSNLATVVGTGPCMRGAGYEYHAAAVAAGRPKSGMGSRQFGLWSVTYAKQWGLGMPDRPIDEAIAADVARYGEEWRSAANACQKQVSRKLYAMGPTDKETMATVADTLERQSYALASATDEWKKAKSDWGVCLSKAGLTPRTGAQEWSSAEAVALMASDPQGAGSSPTQESIRIAVIEATCNTETRMAEQMANLQAAYEGALIRGNEAVLAQEKAAVQKAITMLNDYIAQQNL